MFLCASLFLAGGGDTALKLVEPVEKIWDKGNHNAFTDLIRFKGEWYCVFREGADHAKGAGEIRVLRSKDGRRWDAAAMISRKGVDLRDPHISQTPDGRLMIVGGAADPATRDPVKEHYSFVCFSKDGAAWTEPQRVLDNWQWLWRVTWHKGTAYGVAYSWDTKKGPRKSWATLYRSTDGLKYDKVTTFDIPQPTEATLVFDGDDMLCLQRRDGEPNTAMLGRSAPPYDKWAWKDLGRYFGGPNFIKTPDGSWWAAGRIIENKKAQTVVCRLDVKEAKLQPVLTLPSGGDTSYPGLVWHDDRLWVSYYSSHEKRTSIYLARLQLVR
jgi:hypothetical protein